jgi:hypothetical protein
MRKSNNSPMWKKCQLMKALEGLKALENQLSLKTTKSMLVKKFKWRVPTSFEEAMRSAHSSKWLEAMQDEMRSMSTKNIWDLEEIPK